MSPSAARSDWIVPSRGLGHDLSYSVVGRRGLQQVPPRASPTAISPTARPQVCGEISGRPVLVDGSWSSSSAATGVKWGRRRLGRGRLRPSGRRSAVSTSARTGAGGSTADWTLVGGSWLADSGGGRSAARASRRPCPGSAEARRPRARSSRGPRRRPARTRPRPSACRAPASERRASPPAGGETAVAVAIRRSGSFSSSRGDDLLQLVGHVGRRSR